MVRGNWQKRVEVAQARKDATKQRKQTRKDKENARQLMLQFLNDLDKASHVKEWMTYANGGSSSSGGGNDGRLIHIWTDTCPNSIGERHYSPSHHGGGEGGDSVGFSSPKSSRNAEHSHHATGSGKKHPRSNRNNKHYDSQSSSVEDSSSHHGIGASDLHSPTLQCRNHFFYGTCNGNISITGGSSGGGSGSGGSGGATTPGGSSKKGKGGDKNGIQKSCRFIHFQKDPCWTLANCLSFNPSKDNKGDLSTRLTQSAEAMIQNSHLLSDTDTTHHGPKDQIGMPLTYHIPISFCPKDVQILFNQSEQQSQSYPPTSVSQVVMAKLTQEKCSLSNICYIVVNGTLVYDKFQGGLSILSNDGFMNVLGEFQSNTNNTSTSTSTTLPLNQLDQLDINASSYSNPSNDDNHDSSTTTAAIMKTPSKQQNEPSSVEYLASHLPASLLEYILTFLPDRYVAYLPQVCKHWYTEIGTSSPYLWKHLLKRNHWPVPKIKKDNDGGMLSSGVSSASSLSALLTTPSTTIAPTPMSPIPLAPMVASSSFQHSLSPWNAPPLKKDPTVTERYKFTYLSHYTICRDVKALPPFMKSILGPDYMYSMPKKHQNTLNTNTNHCMAAYQSFQSIRHAPAYPNACIAFKLFDDTRILAAYPWDGTLRLFEAQATHVGGDYNSNNSSGNVGGMYAHANANVKLSCRQVVCIKALPKTIKKQQFKLISMDVDDTHVACLCEVYPNNRSMSFGGSGGTTVPNDNDNNNNDNNNNNNNNHPNNEGDHHHNPTGFHRDRVEHLLTIVSREDLLCAAGARDVDLERDDSLVVVNIQEAVLDYLEEMEDSFRLRPNYHNNDNTSIGSFDRDETKVKVTRDIINCRGGHFCFEVSISRHMLGHYEEEYHVHAHEMPLLVDHKICLFSKSEHRIVWMQDVHVDLWPHAHLTSLKLSSNTASNWNSNGTQRIRQPTLVALVSNLSPQIYMLHIQRNGKATHTEIVPYSNDNVYNRRMEMESDGWNLMTDTRRKVAVLASHMIVVGDTYEHRDGEIYRVQSVLTFYATDTDSDSTMDKDDKMEEEKKKPTSIVLSGNCKILNLEPIGDDYVLAICTCTHGLESEEGQREPNHGGLDYGGQWFEPDDTNTTTQQQQQTQEEVSELMEIRIIHVPKCQEMGCVPLSSLEFWKVNSDIDIPFVLAGSESSLAVGLSWHGIILTGSSVQDVLVSTAKEAPIVEVKKKSGKKKSHQTKMGSHRNKDRKKDGFARGMRMM